MFDKYATQPITHDYLKPTEQDCFELEKGSELIPLDPKFFHLENAYYKQGRPGCLTQMFSRHAIAEKLKCIAEKLYPHAELFLFDAYRSVETQLHLFAEFKAMIRTKHPEYDEATLLLETRKFVYLPGSDGKNPPPHQTGGAIDLSIRDAKTKVEWDFGTAIDEIDVKAETLYFEKNDPKVFGDESRFFTIQKNRRILFHLMKEQGFTNLSFEWWHYDIGNPSWAKRVGAEPIYWGM